MNGRQTQPLLLVEDSEADARLTTRALTQAGLNCPIVYCHDGDNALDYLHQRGSYASPALAIRPSIVLLDLNMPGSDGRYVLRHIKTHALLRTIPVIVLSTSDDRRDIDSCYQYGVNSYVKKPIDFDDLMTSMARLVDFWFATNLHP